MPEDVDELRFLSVTNNRAAAKSLKRLSLTMAMNTPYTYDTTRDVVYYLAVLELTDIERIAGAILRGASAWNIPPERIKLVHVGITGEMAMITEVCQIIVQIGTVHV